jgi:hypothetical protein
MNFYKNIVVLQTTDDIMEINRAETAYKKEYML